MNEVTRANNNIREGSTKRVVDATDRRCEARQRQAHVVRIVYENCLRSCHSQPFVFYIHPWELDPEQPVLDAGLGSKWRHYHNLAGTETKLDGLLRRFKFGTIAEALATTLAQDAYANDLQSSNESLPSPHILRLNQSVK